MSQCTRIVIFPQFSSIQRIVVEQIYELHELYCRNSALIFTWLLAIFERNVSLLLLFDDLGQEHGVDRMGVCFGLEEGKPHLFEFGDGDDLFGVVAHLVDLLAEIVEDSVVHVFSVHFFDYVGVVLRHYHVIDVVVNDARSHGRYSLLIRLLQQLSPLLELIKIILRHCSFHLYQLFVFLTKFQMRDEIKLPLHRFTFIPLLRAFFFIIANS